MVEPLLDVSGLTVRLAGRNAATLVDDVSFTVSAGEMVCIVGESGCGKTVTARSVIGLNRHDPRFSLSGCINFAGRDLLTLREAEMRQVRGAQISMIFQDPMTSLNPLHTVGDQIGEAISVHEKLPRQAIRARTIELLNQVGIANAAGRADEYPHQFSGGMRQRAMIAVALACKPALLIADEPTTALDVTTQMQVLALLARLKDEYGLGVVLITHDLGVVAEIADRVIVMYAGQCVETGEVRSVFNSPSHPYTAGLLASIPAANRQKSDRLPSIRGTPPLLSEGRPSGCAFRTRCDYSFDKCAEPPSLHSAGPDAEHLQRCWLPHAQQLALKPAAAGAEQ